VCEVAKGLLESCIFHEKHPAEFSLFLKFSAVLVPFIGKFSASWFPAMLQ